MISQFWKRSVVLMLVVAMAMGFSRSADASIVTASLPDINGPLNTTGFPINIGSFGPFSYSIPGDALITSASLEGTYGTQAFSNSTAGFDAIVNGALVTVCVPNAPNCWVNGAPFRAFSIALPSSIFASLLSGTATLSIIQTNGNFVRYGSPTLTIHYDTVPEPTTIALIAMAVLSLFGLGMMRRRAEA